MNIQSYILPANGKATPESIARKRRMAESLMASGMDASPIASPWQGAARMAQALVGGLASSKADAQDSAMQAETKKEAMARQLLMDNRYTAEQNYAHGRDALGDTRYNQETQYKHAIDNRPQVSVQGGQVLSVDPNTAAGTAAPIQGYQAPPGTRLITGPEAAKMGLPPGAYNMEPDGKISQIGGKDTNVNINNTDPNAPMMGTIPPGYAAVRDPTSKSGFRLEAISGGQPANDAADALKKVQDTKATADRSSNIVTEDIGRALDLMHGSTLPTTGIGGSITKDIPGTTAHDVQSLLLTIRGNVGFDRLQQMRNNSPTGGALGQINKTELDTLQSVMGNLEQSQSQPQLEYNMKRLNNIVLDIVNGPGQGPPRMDLGDNSTSDIPPEAVQMLKSNPQSAAQFDEQFGPGSAAKILGTK